jgi:hypothetical protein
MGNEPKTIQNLEANLKGLNYPEIERLLAALEPNVLIQLLDSNSVKIGDSAAGLIMGADAYRLLISYILDKKIRTKVGKIRAKNVLFSVGRRYPEALEAYLTFLNDANDGVAHNALLALVFWGDKDVIPKIKERRKSLKSPEDAKEFERACVALENSDPESFDPYFFDYQGIWS